MHAELAEFHSVLDGHSRREGLTDSSYRTCHEHISISKTYSPFGCFEIKFCIFGCNTSNKLKLRKLIYLLLFGTSLKPSLLNFNKQSSKTSALLGLSC